MDILYTPPSLRDTSPKIGEDGRSDTSGRMVRTRERCARGMGV